MAFERNAVHRSRHTPWGGATGAGDIVILGVNWSAAAFVWAFCKTIGGTPSTPNGFSLANAASGSEGVSATYDAAYVHPETGEVVGATRITPQVNEATLEGLTYTGTDPLVLYHDLLVTPSGQPQRPVAYGTLTIHQGIGD